MLTRTTRSWWETTRNAPERGPIFESGQAPGPFLSEGDWRLKQFSQENSVPKVFGALKHGIKNHGIGAGIFIPAQFRPDLSLPDRVVEDLALHRRF